MRIARLAEVLATALLTAGAADALGEFAENAGWLGGAIRDNNQQSILPVLLLGTVIFAALLLATLFGRGRMRVRAARVDSLAAFGAACAFLIAMECYETTFGGLSPFQAGSIVSSHAMELLPMFALVTGIVRALLHGALRIANRASRNVLSALTELISAGIGRAPIRSTIFTSIHGVAFCGASSRCASSSQGRRAPPVSHPL